MEPKKVVVSGFATLDYVVQSSEPFNGTGTVLSELGVANAWPRAGGAALYASRRIAAAGHRSFALTWIGDDGDGGHYLRACQRDQICREAIQQNRGFKTPKCILIYRPDGDYGCLLDVGIGGTEKLSKEQIEVVSNADHLCITAGPAHASIEALKACPPDASVSWITKLDRNSFPPELCRLLAERASIIFCNASERRFLEESMITDCTKKLTVIETRGSDGVAIDSPEGNRLLPTMPVDVSDATGAGDTLAGEVLAQYLTGKVTIDEAVEKGMAAARDLLRSRNNLGMSDSR